MVGLQKCLLSLCTLQRLPDSITWRQILEPTEGGVCDANFFFVATACFYIARERPSRSLNGLSSWPQMTTSPARSSRSTAARQCRLPSRSAFFVFWHNCSGHGRGKLRDSRPNVSMPCGSPMFRHALKTPRNHSTVYCLAAGAILALAGFVAGGCNSLDLRGEPFPRDEAFQWAGRCRQPDSEIEYFGFSNRAMQIERSFGAR